MGAQQQAPSLSEEFDTALRGLRDTRVRPEVVLTETAAPTRLAPFAAAFAAEVPTQAEQPSPTDGPELATGRLVLLHDPDGVEVWQGRYRFVALVRAELDQEMLADPLLPAVGWTWLTESLARHEAEHQALAGTVTRTSSESFGSLAERDVTGDLELRASWTPGGPHLAPHLHAWCELLCVTAGLPPLTEGVVAISRRRRR